MYDVKRYKYTSFVVFHLIAFDHCSSRDRKVATIDTTQRLISLWNISLPFDRFTASVNRLRLSRIRYPLFPFPSSLPYLRPWVAPYFKCHISRDHASSASKMSMPPAGFATTTSHDSSPSWRRGIVSPSRLATNYTLMRHRVIRRRCTKWMR